MDRCHRCDTSTKMYMVVTMIDGTSQHFSICENCLVNLFPNCVEVHQLMELSNEITGS